MFDVLIWVVWTALSTSVWAGKKVRQSFRTIPTSLLKRRDAAHGVVDYAVSN